MATEPGGTVAALKHEGRSTVHGRRGATQERASRRFLSVGWPAVALLAGAALVLGIVGFGDYFARVGRPVTGWDLLYLSLQLFVLESGSVSGPLPWTLQLARFLAPAVAAYATAKAIAAVFRDRFARWRARAWRDHVVVCGLRKESLALSRALAASGRRVVLIEPDDEHDLAHRVRDAGVLLVGGDPTDAAVLRQARAGSAEHVVAFCDSDGMNAGIAVAVAELASERAGRGLSCIVHVVDAELCRFLRLHEIARRVDGRLRIDFVNLYDVGAGLLLAEHPVRNQAAEGDPAQAHVLVVGSGAFAEEVILHAADDWRERYGDRASPLAISVLDPMATSMVRELRDRYPWVAETCALAPIDLPAGRPADCGYRQLRRLIDPSAMGVAYVCLADDSAGLAAALMLHTVFGDGGVPIVLRLDDSAGLAAVLGRDRAGGGPYADVRPFCLLERACEPSLLLAGVYERIARSLHAEYLRHREASGSAAAPDRALVAWRDLPEDLKAANRDQAGHVGAKLQAVGCSLAPLEHWSAADFAFTEAEVERLAEMEHERWVEEREREGWRYGERKDASQRLTPHLREWSALPEDIKEIDRAFVRSLPRVLARAHLQIVRVEGRPGQP